MGIAVVSGVPLEGGPRFKNQLDDPDGSGIQLRFAQLAGREGSQHGGRMNAAIAGHFQLQPSGNALYSVVTCPPITDDQTGVAPLLFQDAGE